MFIIKLKRAIKNLKASKKNISLTIKSHNGKKLNSGERQVSTDLDGIRVDHLGRYEFVLKFLKDNDKILDLACGTGYGTYMLANANKTLSVTGVDISKDAIKFANENYKMENNQYVRTNALKFKSNNKFDKIVSFETIEHIEKNKQLLKNFYKLLKNDGTLFLSTPNENLMPFSKENYMFHFRHYTPDELKELLKECGFRIMEVHSQKTNQNRDLIEGWNGVFNLVVCKKISQ